MRALLAMPNVLYENEDVSCLTSSAYVGFEFRVGQSYKERGKHISFFSYFFKFLEGRFFFSCFLHRRSNKLLLSSSTGKFQKKREQRKFFSLLFERKVFENRESSKKAKIFPKD